MRKLSFFCLVFLGLSVGAIAGCGEEPIPVYPTYSRDIKPLLEARCVRCHGAGGTLNNDPDIGVNATTKMPRVPAVFYANLYNDEGGHIGAHTYAKLLLSYLDPPPAQEGMRMPPPPAQKLTDREIALLTRWANEKPDPLP